MMAMLQIFHKWHMSIGIIAVLFVIMLVVTGIMLNHTDQLDLDSTYVNDDSVLAWYNIHPIRGPVGFKIDNVWVTQLGDRMYFDQRFIDDHVGVLHGVVEYAGSIIAAVDDRLILLTKEGEVIERISSMEGLPADIKKIGLSGHGELIIKAAPGSFRVNLDGLEWEEVANFQAQWSEAGSIPASLNSKLMRQYRGTGLPVERVILDLHSGRILGDWGIYLIDAAAILLLLLALSGFWMWLHRNA